MIRGVLGVVAAYSLVVVLDNDDYGDDVLLSAVF